MKSTNKLLAFFLVIAMFLSVVPMNILAVTELNTDSVIRVESAYGMPGGTVTVDVKISDNPGILGMTLCLEYDDAYATLTSVESGEALSYMTFTTPRDLFSGVLLPWDTEAVQPEDVKDGVIATLTFLISDDAPINNKLNVSLSYVSGAIINNDMLPLHIEMSGEAITVIDYVPGDLNGDSFINTTDVVLLRRYIAGGYGATINESAADVNDDGIFNTTDVVSIRRFIAGGYGIILKPSTPRCNHTMQHYPAKTATCTENGNPEYWHCSECNKYFSDALGANEIALEDTVIKGGHSMTAVAAKSPNYSEKGNIAYWICNTCGKYYTDENGMNETTAAGVVLEVLEPEYHSVIYRNYKTADYPSIVSFAEHEGLENLPTLSVNGYIFEGWYTAEESGEKVISIAGGTSEDVTLYAHWSLEIYTITYDLGNAINHINNTDDGTNVKTYTIESQDFTFGDPVLRGYYFSGWFDDDGIRIKKLTKGMYGDINLTPKWHGSNARVRTISEMENKLYPLFEKKTVADDSYLFVCYLGCIENVPTGTAEGNRIVSYDGTGTRTLSRTESNTHTDETTTYGKTVETETYGWERGFSVKSESEFDIKVVKEKITAEGHFDWNGSDTTTTESGSDIVSNDTNMDSLTDSYTLAPDTNPQGYYWYTVRGTVDVFAVLEFNPLNNTFKYDTIRKWRDEYSLDWLYASTSDEIKQASLAGDLDFTIPSECYDEIDQLIGGSNGFVPQENGSECSILQYMGTDTDVVIPTYLMTEEGDSLKGMKVTGFSSNAFAGKPITSIVLGEGITAIPDSAFENCTLLESITIPETVTEIGANAFKGCEKLRLTIPDTVTTIGSNAFDGCQLLSDVTLPSNLTLMGENVFTNCGVLQLNVNTNDYSIAQAAVNSGASSVVIDANEIFDAEKTLDIPENVSYFELNGISENEFTDLVIVSRAQETVLNNINIMNQTDMTALDIQSAKVVLNAVEVTSGGTALNLSAENADLAIRGKVKLIAGKGKSGILATNLSVHPSLNQAGTLNVTGGIGTESTKGGYGINVARDLRINGLLFMTVTGGDGCAQTEKETNNGVGGIGIYSENIVVEITGSLTVFGGNGADGVADGENGSDGGTGICGNTVTVTCGSLNIHGGNGGNGMKGSDGAVGVMGLIDDRNMRNGGDGSTGGKGGNGADAVFVNEIVIDNSSAILHGGFGGAGGAGGKGGNGAPDYGVYYVHAAYGLNGGNGGKGGAGGNGGAGTVPGIAGVGGKGGAGGSGTSKTSGLFGTFNNIGSDGSSGSKGDDGNIGTIVQLPVY